MADLIAQDTRRTFENSNRAFATEIHAGENNLEAETAIINTTSPTIITTTTISNQQDSSLNDGQRRNKKRRGVVSFIDKCGTCTSCLSNGSCKRKKQTRNSPPNNNNNEDEDEEQELVLKYGAKHVIMLFVPVSACMLFVIISLSIITSYQSSGGVYLLYTPFHETSPQPSTKLWNSLANAGIFIGVVIAMTVVLILLYKYECYKILQGWLAISSLLLLFFFTYMYISELIKSLNIVIDFITLAILMWNFGCIGMMCIHWVGPLRLQQIYLIIVCSQMALIFIKYLPEWTTWVLLAFISIWDLIAVLCPFGPLRILVETAKSRNDKLLPALIYSSTIVYPLSMMVKSHGEPTVRLERSNSEASSININAQNDSVQSGGILQSDDESTIFNSRRNQATSNSNRNNNATSVDDYQDDGGFESTDANKLKSKKLRKRTRQQEDGVNVAEEPEVRVVRPRSSQVQQHEQQTQQEEEEDNGVKLGLGDFIFYSVLVGKAAVLGDWNTVIACFVAVLIGLCFTLVLLAIFHKALPALPISLTFGLIFYFCTNLVVRPFYDGLTNKQYFI